MKNIYRFSFLVFCLFAFSDNAKAQLYGNEWIDYTRTYYKFKVASEGVYRIPKSALDAAGIPGSTVAAQFVLYRDGQEVPLYLTVSAGPLGSNDYIEFYGYGPNGTLDKDLYPDPAWHVNDNVSLFTDTACYYLTYDNQPGHLRYIQVTTGIPGTPPAPEAYCWFSARKDYKNQILPGTNYDISHLLFSSQFDRAESYVDNATGINNPAGVTLETPNYVPGGPDAALNLNVAAINKFAPLNIPIKVLYNNQVIHQSFLEMNPGTSTVKRFVNLPFTVASNTAQVNYDITYNIPNPGYTAFGTAVAEIVYPRNCDLSGLNSFKFRLKPNSANQYIEFANFNNGGGNPKLYDLTNKKWYTGDVQGIKTRFYLDPSLTERELVLFAPNSSVIHSISPVKTINFTNYTVASNQGNYVIISHDALRQSGNGHDYIQEYKDYRSSPQGGSYAAVVADVNELYDQFAYGYDIHPLSIKNFLRYAHNNWNNKPEYALLLGRGLLYPRYKDYLQNQSTYAFPIVPTFGDPGSDVDFVNFGTDLKAKIKIGRISAWNGMEIGNYLNKVKLYEAEIKPASLPTYATEFWKKNYLHIAGGSALSLQTQLLHTLNLGTKVIQDTFEGAYVSTIAKNTTTPIDQIGSAFVDSMIDNGVNWITFHGHASAGNFDFNLNNPEKYKNSPRFPTLLGLGCDVSQIYSLSVLRTISERYINATNGGAISVIAQDNLGYTNFHENYLPRFYHSIATLNYNTTIGTHYNQAYDSTILKDSLQSPSNFVFTEVESMILLGDPAVRVYSAPEPDYHVSDDGLSTLPGTVTTSLDSFQLKINTYNLGRALHDTVFVKVEHTNPQGNTRTIGTYPIADLYSIKELETMIPIDKGRDLGLNKYRVTIDATSKFDEESENNNTAVLSLFIFSDRLIPVYPPEFAIVGQQGVTLKASTLNPFKPVANYKIEIDTTELFNSSQLQQHTTTSVGGIIKWQPSLTYKDSVVYYWRCALDSGNGSTPIWTTSSFVYFPEKSGWNQSHYFQYLKDGFSALAVEEDRKFEFTHQNNAIYISNVVLPLTGNSPYSINDSKVMMNDIDIQRGGCPVCNVCAFWGSIQIMVFDSTTGVLWENAPEGSAAAFPRCNTDRNSHTFEYMVHETQYRQLAAHLLDSIPDGNYVLIRNFIYGSNYVSSFVDQWKTDPGPSLYNSLKNLGLNIDSFDKKRVFVFFRKKGDNSFPVTQAFSEGDEDKIEVNVTLPSSAHEGRMISKLVGPAKQWETMKWRTSTYDNQPVNDSVYVTVSGVDLNGNETFLFTTMNTDTSLSNINAIIYPKLKLEWYSKDSLTHSSSQLDYWRVHYMPLPEAALNPAAHYVFEDSLHVGQTAQLSLAIEELAGLPMDSMLVKYRVIDANGASHYLGDARYKKLNGNDTLHAGITFDPSSYPGKNFLFVEANPDNDQPEHYHPNNLGYISFDVIADKFNPLIDVTFDGVHILDRDIVSARPFIKMTLKDENKFLALDDTSLVDVTILYKEDANKEATGKSPEPVPFDGTTCKFVPGKAGEKNEAMIEYKPTFLEDGIYELAVNGKDKTGNRSGNTDYRISFEVINKSTITNILNYPNPFSTSTAFLFTVTGWMLPSQFKIQIMTVTGKVVREITKAELGPLHIGRNITEYKWDGKDQYGQLLGNGVYLYRVVTAINGEDIEHRTSGADKFTKNGYGKMYIMR